MEKSPSFEETSEELLTVLLQQLPGDKAIELHEKITSTIADRIHRSETEMFKSVLDAKAAFLKAVMLMNGGAAAAMLALLGHLAVKEVQVLKLTALGMATGIFGLGVFATSATTAFAYISQWRLYNGKKAWCTNALAWMFATGSMVCFLAGLAQALQAFLSGR